MVAGLDRIDHVSQEECYKKKVSIRSNEKIQDLNQAYRELAQEPTTRSAMSMCIRLYWMKWGSIETKIGSEKSPTRQIFKGRFVFLKLLVDKCKS